MISTFPRKALALLGLVWVTFGWTGVVSRAQSVEPVDSVRESIEVPLRSVRVVVRDNSGDPVRGLNVEDFRLLHDGEPVTIEGVEELDPPVASADGGSGQAANGEREDQDPPEVAASMANGLRSSDGPRTLVFFVDPAFLEPGDLAEIGPLLRRLGEEQAAGHSSTRWVLLEGRQGVRHVAGPTASIVEIADAWEKLQVGFGVASTLRSEYQSLLREMESAVTAGPDVAARTRELPAILFRGRVESFAGAAQAAMGRAIRRLDEVLVASAGLPGQAEIVYVTGRFPGVAAGRLEAAWLTAFGPSSSWWLERGEGGVGGGLGTPIGGGLTREVDPPSVGRELELGPMLDPVVERAGGLGVVLHAIDAGGLRSVASAFLERSTGDAIRTRGGGNAPSASGASSFGGAEELADLAERTGGISVVGHRDFRPVLAGEVPEGAYLVFFRPPALDRATHHLQVDVPEHRRWRISHPEVYRAASAEDLMARRVLSALLLGLEDDDPLGFELSLNLADGEYRMRIALPLERVALVPDRQAHIGTLTAFFGWGGPGVGVSEIRRARIPVRIPNEELFTALGREAEAVVPVELPQGVPRLAVTLWDELRPVSGTRSVDVPVLDESAEADSSGR